MKKLLVPTLTLAAGFTGGWFFQKRQAPAAGFPPPESGVPAAVATIGEHAASVKNTAAPGKSTAPKNSEAPVSPDTFRAILRAEKNPARATVKMMALLDGMDVAAIAALARQLGNQGSGWYDSESSPLTSLIYGKLAELNPAAALQTALEAKDIWSRVGATSTVIEQMARTDPGAAVAALDKLPQGYLRQRALTSAAAALARTDGPGASTLLQRAKVPPGSWAWSSMISVWASSDPGAAAAHLLTLPRQTMNNSVSALTTAWARRDPAAAMSWAQGLKDPALLRTALVETIGSIAAGDPQQAIALASSQPARDRRTLMTGIATNFGQSDGPGALAWAATLTDPLERQRCLSAIANGAGFADIDTAKTAVNLLPAGMLRNEAISQIGNNLSWSDPVAARDWALTLKPNEQSLVMRRIVSELAEADLAGAEKLVESLPPSGDNQWPWRSVAAQKALQDPAAALTWSATLETEQARFAATSAIFDQWAAHSPDKAAAALAGIADPNMRRRAAETLAATWGAQSPGEATRWAESLTGEDRITALAAVWNASAGDDPRAAGQSLASAAASAGDSATATDKLAHSASNIAAAWAGQSPADAAAWANTLPDGKIREQALGKVAGEWARYDPTAVSEWINGLPHDRSRDSAIGQLVERIANSDPESAFTWATSVDNTEKQAEALKAAALAWKVVNPEAARAAVENAHLPEDVSSRLQEAIR